MNPQSPPSQTHRRNSSGSNSFTSTGTTANSTSPTSTKNNQTFPAVCQDPLAALERDLLSHPTRHYIRSHRHHAQLAPPSLPTHNSRSRSPSPLPAPSPAAQRCMAATAAWTPSLDRRQSWDGQAYRRAMMLQSTGLVCGCHPHSPTSESGPATEPTMRHHHRRPSNSSARSIYESDRGFSEVVGSPQNV